MITPGVLPPIGVKFKTTTELVLSDFITITSNVSLGIAYRWQNVGRSSYLRQGDRKEQAKRQKGQDSFVHLVISQDKQPIIYSFVRTNNQPETLRNHWWLTHR